MYLAITPDQIEVPPGSEITLQDATWETYEALLEQRQDRAGLRIRFNGKTQTLRIMAPLPGHGKRSDTLTDLVKALLKFREQDWDSFHPITLKRLQEAGLEPDACFYIQSRSAILGKQRLDLAIDPPPDLALEIDATSTTDISDYESLKVPEVWIYRGNQLQIYVLVNQTYELREESPQFPGIPVKQLIPEYVERAWVKGSSIALREFELVLRQG